MPTTCCRLALTATAPGGTPLSALPDAAVRVDGHEAHATRAAVPRMVEGEGRVHRADVTEDLAAVVRRLGAARALIDDAPEEADPEQADERERGKDPGFHPRPRKCPAEDDCAATQHTPSGGTCITVTAPAPLTGLRSDDQRPHHVVLLVLEDVAVPDVLVAVWHNRLRGGTCTPTDPGAGLGGKVSNVGGVTSLKRQFDEQREALRPDSSGPFPSNPVRSGSGGIRGADQRSASGVKACRDWILQLK